MAETTVQEVLSAALASAQRGVAPEAGGASEQGAFGTTFADALAEATRSLNGVTSVSQVLSDAVAANTTVVAQNTSAQGAKGVLADAGKAATGFLGSLTLAPVFSAVAKLFGGGSKSETPAPLVRYAAPVPVRLETAQVPGSSNLVATDRGDDGQIRLVNNNAPAPQQVTVQVQTLDSRSFLDHSTEIARAVREAMLNMHSINDVVNDL